MAGAPDRRKQASLARIAWGKQTDMNAGAVLPGILDRVGSRLGAGEQALLDDGVDAPIAVNHLGDAVIHRHRHQ